MDRKKQVNTYIDMSEIYYQHKPFVNDQKKNIERNIKMGTEVTSQL